MKRRDFSKLSLGLSGAALLSISTTACAQKSTPAQSAPKAGTNYAVLKNKVPTDAPAGKVEVIEFFGYWCPHCNAFEPQLEAWLKSGGLPKNASFKRVAVAFGDPQRVPLQRLYFTLEAMGKVDSMQSRVYAAVHQQRVSMFTDADVKAWIAKQPDIDAKKFNDIYGSFAVNSQIQKANQLVQAYQIGGVPSFGVGGKFYTDGGMAGNMSKALQVVQYLVPLSLQNS